MTDRVSLVAAPLFAALLFCLPVARCPAGPGASAPPAPPAKMAPAGAVLIPAERPPAQPTLPKEHSHYAILVDAASGKVLWTRNADAERPIASTTKIMTAILLLERGKLDAVVTAPKGVNKIEESSLHLTPGETLTLHDLLYAMLLRSANDTAVAGATYLSGSVPAFVTQMNAKAREIGAAHTHFVTPNGLYARGHYSTASDLAKMACYAVNHLPEFNEIVRTPRYRVTRSMHVGDVWVKNTAVTFLKTFPGADGIKTGYIRQAGHCFVGSATRRNWRLIAVALDSPTCREDVMSLLDYGFANWTRTVAVSKGTALGTLDLPTASAPVPVAAAADLAVVVPRFKPLPPFETRLAPLQPLPEAPIRAGTRVGTVTVLIDGKPQVAGDLLAVQDVAVRPAVALFRGGARIGGELLWAGAIALGLGLLAFLGRMGYVRAAAKGARGGRHRLAPGVRRVDQAGPRPGRRPGSNRTWRQG